jgi:hypothetical protein
MEPSAERLRAAMISSVVAVTALLGACPGPQPPAPSPSIGPAPSSSSIGLAECPHTWDSVFRVPPALSQEITDIPEFHDCQRFILANGHTYDSLYAIFAAKDLGVRYEMVIDSANPDSVEGQPRRYYGLALADIWSIGGNYPQLGVKPGWNCLFLYFKGDTLKAKMVPVGRSDQPCKPSVNPEALVGTMLLVHREPQAGYQDKDYPPVARWDADTTPGHYLQYAGLKCGDAWCEVGPATFRPSLGRSSGAATAHDRRVVEIKGWYDWQQLQMPTPGGNGPPSSVFGFATPDPALDTLQIPSFQSGWVHAAEFETNRPFVQFLKKLGIDPAAGRGPFEVFLCAGSRGACHIPRAVAAAPECGVAPTWWARITWGVGDRREAYRCVTRIDHAPALSLAGLTLPGAARWRWVSKDETVWMRCDAGCCTIR